MSAAPPLLAIALGAPVVALGLARTAPPRPDQATTRAARAIAVGAAAALGLLVATAGRSGSAIGPLEADAFAALVLVLVLGVGATVLGFAARSLRHEPYQRRFATVGAGLVLAAATFASADDLLLLGAAWLATGALTVALVRTGPDAGRDQRSARLRQALVVGDPAVVAALAILAVRSGTTDLAGLDAGGAWGAAAGALLVVGAAARSAVAPFHRWLPDTLGAPTPSSALLHAGVVNGGAILLLTLAPALTPHLAPSLLAVIVGGASCAFAEAVMLTRPDVKGRLAWSTVAQMSFTLVLVGLGLVTAAALHLVAHGMYKGALFLGSGSTVRGLVRSRSVAPGSVASPALRALTVGLVVLAAGAVVVATNVTVSADLLVPLGLATATATVAGWGWLGRAVGRRQAIGGLAAAAGLVAAFALVTIGLKAEVRPALEGPTTTLPAALVLVVLAVLVAVAEAHRHADHPRVAPAWRRIARAGRPVPLAARPARRVPTVPSSAPSPAVSSGLLGG